MYYMQHRQVWMVRRLFSTKRTGFTLIELAGSDRDHRRFDKLARAGRAKGAGIGEPRSIPEQFETACVGSA